MSVHPLSFSPISILPKTHVAALKHQKFSSTDWKTHFLIILSHLLLSFGVMLAFASLYFFRVVHPVFALTLPAIPIALGIIGIQSCKKEQVAFKESKTKPISKQGKIVPFMQGQPFGLKNLQGENCGINAVFQLIANCEDYKSALDNIFKGSNIYLKETFTPLKKAVDIYDKERNASKDSLHQISSVDTQSIRGWLSKVNPCMHRESANSPQLDAFEVFLKFFLEKIDHRAPKLLKKNIEKSRISNNALGNIQIEDPIENPINFRYVFDLIPSDCSKKSVNLQELFDNYFSPINFFVFFKKKESKPYFKYPPQDLTLHVHHPQNNYFEKKLEEEAQVDLPLIYVANKEQFGSNAIYSCDGFINHEGDILEAGHYVAYIRKLKIWWELDDQQPMPKMMSDDAIKEKLRKACIVHYINTKK